jgi:hypothetical protein
VPAFRASIYLRRNSTPAPINVAPMSASIGIAVAVSGAGAPSRNSTVARGGGAGAAKESVVGPPVVSAGGPASGRRVVSAGTDAASDSAAIGSIPIANAALSTHADISDRRLAVLVSRWLVSPSMERGTVGRFSLGGGVTTVVN